jgi:hypothetical protein
MVEVDSARRRVAGRHGTGVAQRKARPDPSRRRSVRAAHSPTVDHVANIAFTRRVSRHAPPEILDGERKENIYQSKIENPRRPIATLADDCNHYIG